MDVFAEKMKWSYFIFTSPNWTFTFVGNSNKKSRFRVLKVFSIKGHFVKTIKVLKIYSFQHRI